jgi:hypothetical protein
MATPPVHFILSVFLDYFLQASLLYNLCVELSRNYLIFIHICHNVQTDSSRKLSGNSSSVYNL